MTQPTGTADHGRAGSAVDLDHGRDGVDPNKDAMMAQAELAQATNRPDLAQELPVDPQARAETRARAAHSVATFAQTSALEALDALLAAEGPEEARAVADAARERGRLLDTEVARFRALADQTA